MAIACRRRRRVPNARWPTWWTWSAGSPAGRWTRWRWNCPARPRAAGTLCRAVPRAAALSRRGVRAGVFPRRPRDAATLGQRGAGPVARSLRRRIPGAFQHQPHHPSGPADPVPAVAAGRKARTGGPGAAPVAAHLATTPPGGGHQLPATARRHTSGYGRSVSPAARPDLAGSRLPAGFRRSEQFLPGIPPLVRLHAQRIPGAPPGAPGLSPGQAVRFRAARRVAPRPGAGSSRGPGPTACRRPCRRR